MKFSAKSIMLLTLFTASTMAKAQLLIDEARDAKNKTDRIMGLLNIPTTRVDVTFPRSYVKAALDQMIVDLPKIEMKVTDLINTQGEDTKIEVQLSANSGSTLFLSCQNKVKTNLKINGQDVAHELVIIPSERGQVSRVGDEWFVSINGTDSVELALVANGVEGALALTQFVTSPLPLPSVNLGNLSQLNSGLGNISSAQLRAQSSLFIKNNDVVEKSCANHTPFQISSFATTLLSNTGNRTVNETGPRLSLSRSLLQNVRSGDVLSFNNIKLQHPDYLNTQIFSPNVVLFIK